MPASKRRTPHADHRQDRFSVGRRIDESSPIVDARLPDGSRVNAIIPPLALDGPILSIRRLAVNPFELDDLIGFQTLTPEMAGLSRES